MTEDLKSGLPVVRAGIQRRASNRLASPPPNGAIWRRDFEFPQLTKQETLKAVPQLPSFFLVRQLKRVRYKKKMPSLARLEVRGQCERERLKKKQRNCFTSVTWKFAKKESRLETPCSLVTRCSRGFYQTIAMHAYFISVSARSKETKQVKKSYWYREHFEFVHGPGWTLWLWTVLGLPHSPGAASFFAQRLACSRLRDGGEKSFSKKKCEKRAGAGERQGPLSQVALVALLVLIRPHYTIWEPGTGYTEASAKRD